MTNPERQPSLEDVLDEFAMESDTGRATLERYLTAFPLYATGLLDMSRELGRSIQVFEGPLAEEDINAINEGWKLYEAAAPHSLPDPWTSLSVAELRHAAGVLGVPRQVLTAFRERRILPISVPDRFLMRLSQALGAGVEVLRGWMTGTSMGEPVRSYKADDKPVETVQVTFDRILLDAGVPPEQRADLLSNTD